MRQSKEKATIKCASGLLTLLGLLLMTCICLHSSHIWAKGDTPHSKKYKILHIMSYHSPWKWTDDQLAGFKEALKDVDVEYKVFQMDTKRNSSKESKEIVGSQARELIESWKPDLVYTNDDNAQEYVVKYYINHDTPFVFSGVNADPGEYGFDGSLNIAGIIEQEHFVESIELLKMGVPDIRKIAIVLDEGSTWPGVVRRMKAKLEQLPDIEIVSWDVIHSFAQYKQKIRSYQDNVDAIGLLGIFTFKDDFGDNVPYQEVLKWTADNSQLPDFSFWKDRISHGTLCTVTVSGYEQGLAAGKIAHGILVDGRTPASFAMVPTVKGEAVISLARANRLGISFKSSILLSAEIIESFSWNN